MRHLKLLLVAFAIMISSAVFANPEERFANEKEVSNEIQKIMEESSPDCREMLTVTVFFSILSLIHI